MGHERGQVIPGWSVGENLIPSQHPYWTGFTRDGGGNLYLAGGDWGSRETIVGKFSPTGQDLAEWHVPQEVPFGDAWTPITVDEQDHIYLFHTFQRGVVVEFTQDGHVLHAWRSSAGQSDNGSPFVSAAALAADQAGHVYLVDFVGEHVLR